MKYPVVARCGVNGVTYEPGHVIDMDEIHEGSRQSLLRLGVLGNPLPEPKVEEAAPESVKVEPANDPPATNDAPTDQPKPVDNPKKK